MVINLQHHELFNIKTISGPISYGGDQEWYIKNWHQRAGCGPTSASNITMYLAHTNTEKSGLYPYDSTSQVHFSTHMESLFDYVTPGMMGVNHIDMFVDGISNYAKDMKVPIKISTFTAEKKTKDQRNISDLIEFAQRGLSMNCPLAFLVLSRGEESILQNWHWITITSIEINGDSIMATASDEGEVRRFNLGLWYLTTKMHGGLVYIQ